MLPALKQIVFGKFCLAIYGGVVVCTPVGQAKSQKTVPYIVTGGSEVTSVPV